MVPPPREEHSSRCQEPIAIVGMGCRWPGGVSDAGQLWTMLKEKRSGYSDFDKDKINIDGFLHPDPQRPGSLNTKGGYFLREDPRLFDHAFFGITPLEARAMDPAQRKLLEVTYEAFENAGEPWHKVSGSQTGVYVGNFNSDHSLMQLRDPDYSPKYATTGGDVAILSNRVNYVFDLKGPSVTINTACSSSMYALHLAVTAIRNGDCSSAIVAGTNIILGPDVQMLSVRLGALSATSTCHTFDAAADGYARAEGIGCLYLKPLSAALSGGYPVRSVIRGTAVNANGRTSGISHPNPEGQEEVIRRAYENAGGLDLNLTGYFECHGTGTPVGDPIEVHALGQVFGSQRQEPLLIGSVKTNLGHGESSSGIAAIMKATLAIEHGLIPPSIGLENINPNINLEKDQVRIVTELTPWPDLPVRRASINSFGYGGANAHCILEHVSSVTTDHDTGPKISFKLMRALHQPTATDEKFRPQSAGTNCLAGPDQGLFPGDEDVSLPITCGSTSTSTVSLVTTNSSWESIAHPPSQLLPSEPRRLSQSGSSTRRLVLLPVSAHNEKSLHANAQRLAKAANAHNLSDLAYTLCARRSHFKHRAFLVVDCCSPSDGLVVEHINHFKGLEQSSPSAIWVFTGQGASWVGMGKELFEFRIFRDVIRYQDSVLSRLSNSPPWTIEELIINNIEPEIFENPLIAQTICTALQVALVSLLRSWNAQPTAVIGHSSGEIAAVYAAGLHTAAEAIIIAYARGQALLRNKRKGRMIAVGLSNQDVRGYIGDQLSKVQVAAVNSPNSVTVSGDEDLVDYLLQTLDNAGVFVRPLKTGGNAYHSHHMFHLGSAYEGLIDQSMREVTDLIEAEPLAVNVSALWSSSVCGEVMDKSRRPTTRYWRENLESPVLFAEALTALYRVEDMSIDLHVEIGPHPALKTYVRQVNTDLRHGKSSEAVIYLKSLSRGEDGLRSVLDLAGTLFKHGVSIDLAAINAIDRVDQDGWYFETGSTCTDLPTYAYSYDTVLYAENRINYEWRLRKHLRHDLLGARLPGTARGQPTWRNVLRMTDVAWLADHKLLPSTVFPAAGFIAMAIEAVSQLHSEGDQSLPIMGFSLRNLSIISTLQIPDDNEPVELILSMQASSLTASAVSHIWKDFRISSTHDRGERWVEHCYGQICVEASAQTPLQTLEVAGPTRSQDLGPWYRKFAQKGIVYGPSFSCMEELRTQRDSPRATARVKLVCDAGDQPGHESQYPLHPTSIDMCLQLALIACHYGRVESVKTSFVPVFARKMSLWIPQRKDQQPVWGTAIAHGELKGLKGAECNVQLHDSDNSLLLEINHLRCVAYQSGEALSTSSRERERCPYFRSIWKPLFSRLSNDSCRMLFPPATTINEIGPIHEKFHRLAAYIICQFYTSQSRFFKSPYPKTYHAFLSWIERTFQAANTGKLRFGIEAMKASNTQRAAVINEIVTELHHIVEIKLVERMYASLPAILDGRADGLETALGDNLLPKLYDAGLEVKAGYCQLKRLVDLMAHENPRMNILEIGAGTGGATRHVLEALVDGSTGKRYNLYTFTDVTPSFLSSAESEFSDHSSMEYGILDIERDPLSQGYEPVYDLVIASQSLHATSDIAVAVQNARSLLRAGGKMILFEMTRVHPLAGLILGTLPNYWNGINDDRTDSPFLSETRWNNTLEYNGFSGCDLVLGDHPEPYTMASVIVASAVDTALLSPGPTMNESPIHVISSSNSASLVHNVCQTLRNQGTDVSHVLFGIDEIPYQARVIFFADVLVSCLLENDETLFSAAKSVLLRASSAVCVTAAGVLNGSQPLSASVNGLLRTVAREYLVTKLLCLDLSSEHAETTVQDMADLIVSVESKLVNAPRQFTPVDRELAWHNGILHASRLMPDRALNDRFIQSNDSTSNMILTSHASLDAITLDIEQPGLFGSTYFRPSKEFEKDLEDDWVQVKTCAAGVNFKDLAVLTGRVDINDFGLEASGVVSKVGRGITSLQEGDRVYGHVRGRFGTHVRAPSGHMQKIPSDVSFVEAASMPIVFMTVVYAFVHLARVQEGQSVLIQSASGGIGLAAIQLARHLGARIFATVGSIEKRNYVARRMGLPADHVFVTRDRPIAAEAMKATKSRGFDIILCSATGETMEDIWNCIAPMGHFIDIGRRDVLEHGKLAMDVFQRNATFSSFDLGTLFSQQSDLCSQLSAEVSELLTQKAINPINNITTFDVSEIQHALAYFSRGQHVGKVVISYENPETTIKFKPFPSHLTFDPEASYLLAGGLGGFGQSLSMWLAERGAKHLIFLSRSTSTGGKNTFLDRLRNVGAKPTVIQCDISQRDELLSAIQQLSECHPVRGVINAAGVTNDKLFEQSSLEDVNKVLRSKVQGTINLDEATKECRLKFFIMISSAITFASTVSQGAYNMANRFLDNFARHRRQRGLPAQSVSMSLVTEVGMASDRPDYEQSLNRNGLYGTGETETLQLFEAAFVASEDDKGWSYDPLTSAHLVLGFEPSKQKDLSDRCNHGSEPWWYNDARMSVIRQAIEDFGAQSPAPGAKASTAAMIDLQTLAAQTPEDRSAAITSFVTNALAKLLYTTPEEIDRSKTISSYGIDSMVATEMRSEIKTVLEVTISLLEMLDSKLRVKDLVQMISTRIE